MANLLFLVIVVVLYFLAYRRPGFACGYVLASYALEQCAQAFVPVAGINNSLCNFLIAGAVVVGIVGQILRSGLRIIKIDQRAAYPAALQIEPFDDSQSTA